MTDDEIPPLLLACPTCTQRTVRASLFVSSPLAGERKCLLAQIQNLTVIADKLPSELGNLGRDRIGIFPLVSGSQLLDHSSQAFLPFSFFVRVVRRRAVGTEMLEEDRICGD